MTMNELASEVAHKEGKKEESSVANIREILAIVCDMVYANPEIGTWLHDNGKKRAMGHSEES